jgi:hypothetical protein
VIRTGWRGSSIALSRRVWRLIARRADTVGTLWRRRL